MKHNPTPEFIGRHHRPDHGNAMGRTRSLAFFIASAQRSLANDTQGDAGPTNRSASHDDRRRHLSWMQTQAFLSQLSDYRAAQQETNR